MDRRTLVVWVVALVAVAGVQANDPYPGYVYNVWNESVPAPNSYLPDDMYNGLDLGVGLLSHPKDIFVDHNDDLYILDSGNGRIVVLNDEMEVERVIDSFRSVAGAEAEALAQPEGLFVTPDDTIYVADTQNNRVVVMDQTGAFLRTYAKPTSELFPAELEFLPVNVVVDSTDVIYILARGLYYGAVMYDPDGRFLGFFGSNRVEATAEVIAQYFWKNIMSEEQRERMTRFVPVEYTNFDIDGEDFIYTCTAVSRLSRDEIKKLNPMGDNIYAQQVVPEGDPRQVDNFGDLEVAIREGEQIDSRLHDIVVDEAGFVTVLDQQRGKVFQYDQDGNLISVFGGIADQVGTFRLPVAVEVWGNRVVVLDDEKASITLFSPTSFGETVREAVTLYKDGFYQEAVAPWREVLTRCINYEPAYIGIGKAEVKTGDYQAAMRNFDLGFDKTGYSEAYEEYRTSVVRRNFSYIMLSLLVLFVVQSVLVRRRKRRQR